MANVPKKEAQALPVDVVPENDKKVNNFPAPGPIRAVSFHQDVTSKSGAYIATVWEINPDGTSKLIKKSVGDTWFSATNAFKVFAVEEFKL